MARKYRRYTDDERATFVVMLESAGYPDKKGALELTSSKLKIPRSTLRGWFIEYRNPPPAKLRQEKRKDLADIFETIAYDMLDHAGDPIIIGEMDGKAAVIAAATATDKMRLLRGLPTEIVAILPNFIQAIENMGHSPVEVMSRMIERSSHVEH